MKYRQFNKRALESLAHMQDKNYVICADTALDYWGLTLRRISTIHVLTSYRELDGLNFLYLVIYHYSDDIDYENYLIPYEHNSKILFPTQERAIIDIIKIGVENIIDEGTFLDALYNYKEGLYYNYNLLMKVADFYKLDRTKVDYWLNECEEVGSWG